MAKYRKRESIVEATRWYSDLDHDHVILYPPEFQDSFDICNDCNQIKVSHGIVSTLECMFVVCPGDWVIDTGDAFFPCKPDLFETCYEIII